MRKILFLVENLPSPFDRRVWQEATALRAAGHGVSIICPTGKGCEKHFEEIDGIAIYRYMQLIPERPATPNLDRWYAAISSRAAFKEQIAVVPLS